MKYRLRRGFTLIELLTVITIIAILAGFATNISIKVFNTARTNEAVRNMNNILTMISIFQQEENRFPEGTEENSNSHLRELFAEGYLDGGGEIVFFVPRAEVCTEKPDGLIGDEGAPDALEKGTVGFAYVAELQPSSSSGTPIMFDAYKNDGKFDEQLHNGIVLVGTISGAVNKLEASGAQALENGINLADVINAPLYEPQSGNQSLLQPEK